MYLQKAAVVSSVVSWMQRDDAVAGVMLSERILQFLFIWPVSFYPSINIEKNHRNHVIASLELLGIQQDTETVTDAQVILHREADLRLILSLPTARRLPDMLE